MLESQHSSGQAAYVFDILDQFFLGSFCEDANKIFEDFDAEKVPEAQEE